MFRDDQVGAGLRLLRPTLHHDERLQTQPNDAQTPLARQPNTSLPLTQAPATEPNDPRHYLDHAGAPAARACLAPAIEYARDKVDHRSRSTAQEATYEVVCSLWRR